jgi:hypothetical protein
MHQVRWRELAAAGHDAAVTAVRDLAAGRALLLAEVAGILERASEVCRQAAQPCRDAGADREAIPAWMEEGRSRRPPAIVPPFSGRYARQRSRQPPIPSPRASVLINLSVNVELLDVIAEPMHSSL